MQETPVMNEVAESTSWHEQAFGRITAGIIEKWREICIRHNMADEFTQGWLIWFGESHPEHFKKWWAAFEKINALWLEGRTDAEAQKEFNQALRMYRDGALWCCERYIGWKKDQEAKARAEAENVGKQEKMALR